MGDKTPIQWTDASWNPLAAFDRETGKRGWFCTKVSDGCTKCYAEGLNKRLGTGHLYRAGNLPKIEFRLVNLDQPARWTRPRRIFVNSMTDLFHEEVSVELIDRVFAAMALARQHVFQVLTKRPERMSAYSASLPSRFGSAERAAELLLSTFPGQLFNITQILDVASQFVTGSPHNVWLGTSIEHQKAADERVPELLRTRAAIRFLSCEPLLGPIDFSRSYKPWGSGGASAGALSRIRWAIVGGESGTKARPLNVEWARSLVRQCQSAGVSVFVKQLGLSPYFAENGARKYLQLKDHKGGDWNEWPEDLRVRDFPRSAVPA
jgi:protein gp37